MCGQHCDFCFALKWLLQNKLRISNIFGEFFNFPIASLDDFLFFYFRKNCIMHHFLNTENDNSFSDNTHMKYKQIYLSGSNEFISDCWCPEGFLWVYSKVSIQLFLGNLILNIWGTALFLSPKFQQYRQTNPTFCLMQYSVLVKGKYRSNQHKGNKLEKFSTTQFHTILLCLYVADPAIFLASNCVLGTCINSENSLSIQLWKR